MPLPLRSTAHLGICIAQGSLSTAATLMLNIWMKRKAYSTSERRQAYTENMPKAQRNMPYRLTLPYRKGQPFSPSAAFRRA